LAACSQPAAPAATPVPVFQKWTTSQVIAAFKAASLEAEDARPMTKDDYGLAPMLAVEATHFTIPSLCADCGGRLFSFETPEKLETTKIFYEKLSESSAAYFSWVFIKDNILVQINGDLPDTQAQKYQDALNSLK